MASLTIRNIPEDAKLRFRQVAAAHGRSMEEHLRQLVIDAEFAANPSFKGVSDMTQSFRHFEPDPKAKSRARIERLIKLGRGVDWQPEPRTVEKLREIDFG
jgi:plasmid stability protein